MLLLEDVVVFMHFMVVLVSQMVIRLNPQTAKIRLRIWMPSFQDAFIHHCYK